MRHDEIPELAGRRAQSKKSYLEFLRTQTLSAGLYVLHAGQQDLQQPHSEDEVYHVIQGRARFRAGAEECDVQSGSVLFVEAGLEHRFFEIEEDLTILVVFAPPEGTAQA